MLQLTALRGGCIGRAYRLSPFPVFLYHFTLRVSTQIRKTVVEATTLTYVLRVREYFRRGTNE